MLSWHWHYYPVQCPTLNNYFVHMKINFRKYIQVCTWNLLICSWWYTGVNKVSTCVRCQSRHTSTIETVWLLVTHIYSIIFLARNNLFSRETILTHWYFSINIKTLCTLILLYVYDNYILYKNTLVIMCKYI